MISGIVSFVSEKPWGTKVLHSFRLANDDKFYNCGTISPGVHKGQFVEFDGKPQDQSRFQVNLESIRVLKEAVTEVSTPSRGGNFRKPFVKDETKELYWRNREERDIKTQQIIQLQSSRNSAIEMAKYIVEHGGLEVGKLSAAAKAKGTLEDLVDHYTSKFEEESNTRRANLDQKEVIPEIAKAESVEVTKQAASEDNWE